MHSDPKINYKIWSILYINILIQILDLAKNFQVYVISKF